jgi:hypothetical protein
LVGGVSRVGVDIVSKIVVAFCRAPIALLVLVDKLSFAIAREVTEVNQGLVAGLEDEVLEGRGYARARGRLGS